MPGSVGRSSRSSSTTTCPCVRTSPPDSQHGSESAASQADLDRVLTLLDLGEVADRPAGELSQGRRQLVSIARALVGNPRVVLLDEPASGLDTGESQWLGERLRRIRDSGVTILMVDHDMHLVLNLCDQIQVLNFGVLIASRHSRRREGGPYGHRSVFGQHARRAGHGDHVNEQPDQSPVSNAPPLLECRELTAGYGRVNIVRPFDLLSQCGNCRRDPGPERCGQDHGAVHDGRAAAASGRQRPGRGQRAQEWASGSRFAGRPRAGSRRPCAVPVAQRARQHSRRVRHAAKMRVTKCSSCFPRCVTDGSCTRVRCLAASNRCSQWPGRSSSNPRSSSLTR